MLHIDTKYICLVGPNLRNFKKKKSSLFNCSCPICGDSEKKKSKARGFFYQKGQSMFYKCHNCSAGMGVGNFLKQIFPAYYDEYLLEKYKSGVDTTKTREKVSKVVKVNLVALKSNHAQKIKDLDDNHPAKLYVRGRNIPETHHSVLYYTDDFAALVDDIYPGKYSNLARNDKRLVIPFFDESGSVLGLQGRSLFSDTALRYITIRSSSNIELVYGLDRFDPSQPGFVVEGPIDSLFLPNCLAAANSDLCSALDKVSAQQTMTLVYDNEPRNKEIVKLMSSAIDAGRSVCIWPDSFKEKDINEMVLSGKSAADILATIRERSASGLSAQLEFTRWRKV